MRPPLLVQMWLEFSSQKTDNGCNNTRQGYARKRILKPAGSSFTGRKK